jgi:ubiquinone/menaquinone biosynthesis C-methylase UbiE
LEEDRPACLVVIDVLPHGMEEPSCFLTTGFLNGPFSAVNNQHVRETRCITAGDLCAEWETTDLAIAGGDAKMNTQEIGLSQPGLPKGFVGWIMTWMMPFAHGAIYKRVSKVLNLHREDDLAEIACGGGHFLKKYASQVRRVAGLDLSHVQVKMARRKLRARISAGTAEIVQGDASKLPWVDNRFSVVTTMGSIVGFAKPLESLKEMHRVLHPTGRAVVSIEMNAEDGKDYSKYVEKGAMWVWTEDEVRSMMKEAGFSEISITYDRGPGMPKMMFAGGVKQ